MDPMIIKWLSNGTGAEERSHYGAPAGRPITFLIALGHILAWCSSLLGNPNVVDLIQLLLRRGLLLAHAHRLVRLYEAVSTGSCPPVHSLDHVASSNKTGCRSNQHFRSICFFSLSLVNNIRDGITCVGGTG